MRYPEISHTGEFTHTAEFFNLAQTIVDESAMAGGDGYNTAYYRFRYSFIGRVGAHGLSVEPPPRLLGHRVIEGDDVPFEHVVFSGFNEARAEIIHVRSLSETSEEDFAVAWLHALTGNVTYWPELDVDVTADKTILHRGKHSPRVVIEHKHKHPGQRVYSVQTKGVSHAYTPLNILEEAIKATTPSCSGAVALQSVVIPSVMQQQVQQ